MEEERPNYYAVIPANVRYDDNLKLGEKMMYGEITSLTFKTGECWASNSYFAKLYKVSPQAISKWIKNLEKNKYINITYETEGKLIVKRIIRMVSTDIDRVSTTVEGGINHSLEGYQHRIKENNTSINNTSINNIYKKYGMFQRVKLTDKEYEKLIKDFGKDFIEQQIKALDEYIEINNNKNKYTNFNLVLRKAIREKWFAKSKQEPKEAAVPEWFDKDLNTEQRKDDGYEDFLRRINQANN